MSAQYQRLLYVGSLGGTGNKYPEVIVGSCNPFVGLVHIVNNVFPVYNDGQLLCDEG